MIPAAIVLGEHGFVPHSGGAIFNTAIALERLDAQAGPLTGLSTEMFGEQQISTPQISHVSTAHIIHYFAGNSVLQGGEECESGSWPLPFAT